MPQALGFAEADFCVCGFDIDPAKSLAIGRAESYMLDIASSQIDRLVWHGRLQANADFSRLVECEAVVMCVPTPLTAHREPDVSAIEGTLESLVLRLRAGQLRKASTTPPAPYPLGVLERLGERLDGLLVETPNPHRWGPSRKGTKLNASAAPYPFRKARRLYLPAASTQGTNLII